MIFHLKNNKKQQGVTLIELMISLLIGLVLLAGVLRIFVNSSQLNRHLSNISGIQEDGRIGANFLKQTISLAGYRTDIKRGAEASYYPVIAVGTDFNAGAAISGTDGADNIDSVSIRFLTTKQTGLSDCLGLGVGVGANDDDVIMIFNRFFVRNKVLLCESRSSIRKSTTQPLISNVEKFDVLYGMATDPANITVSCYLSAKNVTTDEVTHCQKGVNFKQVASIRINLILSTDGKNLTHDGKSHDFTYANMTVNDVDKRLYRGLTLDIALRNKITTMY